MNLQPITFSFILILVSLISFGIALSKENLKPIIYITISTFLLGYGSFIVFYTDTLVDGLGMILLFGISSLLLAIPCLLLKKKRGYMIVFVATHIVAAILLSAVKKLGLISSPSYITSLLFVFAYIYIIGRNEEFLKAVVVIVLSITLSMTLHLDYSLPFTFDIWPSNDTIITTQCKPVIAATDYFKQYHNEEHIKTTETIHQDGNIYVFITTGNTPGGYFFIYEDGTVQPFSNDI
ncbi:MAG: hypothetical protein JEZ08_22925 [Clostridiales bacterium]|nr:hypothetical protein [Clostridiales bacterium]